MAKYGQRDFARMVERIRGRQPSGWTAMYDALGVFLIRRRVDHQHLRRLVAGHREHMRRPRRKKAAVAGFQLAGFAVDLGSGPPFDQVAHLLDAGMRVRERAFSFFDRTENDFEPGCADVVLSDQAPVDGSGVVRRMVGGHILRPHKVA